MNKASVEELRELIGSDVLLLRWPSGSKGTKRKWGHLTIADMTPGYLAKLGLGNIGVALGEKSGDLCCLDIDRDEFVGPFLAANPEWRRTLQTHGARGRVFWFRCMGDYPKRTIKLKTLTGEAAGEFRSNGSQSIIWGIHPDTRKPYKMVYKAKPIEIDFSAIVWPKGVIPLRKEAGTQTHRAQKDSSASCVLDICVSASLDSCVPASLHHTPVTVLSNILAKKEAQQKLRARHPNLAELYTSLIEPRFQAVAHGRNDFIVQGVPFLYRAVAARLVLELVACFYDCNRSLFNDSREQHMKEANAMLEAVTASYAESLSTDERKIYTALNAHEQDAFRICRDLALLPEPEREPLTFFLSFNHLASRLEIHPMQAQRILRQLAIYGLIRLLKKGTRRAPGVTGEAGTYRWQLAPPEAKP